MPSTDSQRQRIETELERARMRLLDLSMRNRLLNFSPTKLRTLRIIDEISSQIYEELVLNQHFMDFLPLPNPEESLMLLEANSQDNDNNQDTLEDEFQIWEFPENPDRHSDCSLQTNLKPTQLQKRLFYIHNLAQSAVEETGSTILFLALGFLKWSETPEALTSHLAPLVLVPVDLEREKAVQSFRLRWTQEDIGTNISLQAKLSEQGVDFPEFEMPENVFGFETYLQNVKNAIIQMPGWEVTDEIFLGFFSFAKFLMYKDLDHRRCPEGQKLSDHPLIQEILSPSGVNHSDIGFQEDQIDSLLPAGKVYHIMDADPSQIAVIEDAKAKRNFVVEGPPGTGKSQTITNIIAEFLAIGKTVLFVSEKMAALEVVKKRLDQADLGDFCLELHSRKSNKKKVLEELRKTLELPRSNAIEITETFNRLERLKEELNTHSAALGEKFGKIEWTFFSLISRRERARRYFESLTRQMPKIQYSEALEVDQNIWNRAFYALLDLKEALKLVEPLSQNPWHGTDPTFFSISDEEEMVRLIHNARDSTHHLTKTIEKVSNLCAWKVPLCLADLNESITACKLMAVAPCVEKEIILNPIWDEPSELIKQLLEKVENVQQLRVILLDKFKPSILGKDLSSHLLELKKFSTKPFRIFFQRYRELKQEIALLYKDQVPSKLPDIISDLAFWQGYKNVSEHLESSVNQGRDVFGINWEGEESKLGKLREIADWLPSFRVQILKGIISSSSIEIISEDGKLTEIKPLLHDLENALNNFVLSQKELLNKVNLDPATSNLVENSEGASFILWDTYLNTWEMGLPKLQSWCHFREKCKAVLNSMGGPVVEEIIHGKLEPDDILPCFEGTFAEEILRQIFSQRPDLRGFIGDLHNQKIKEFVELDKKLIFLNRKRLAARIFDKRPKISGGASLASEEGILLGEMNRKKGHMPIRKLLERAGGLITRLKPCFLMSPISIAQFLTPGKISFDLVLFDEASQVTPEDALGALWRGHQVVVMGDTQQLPPTNFFDQVLHDDGKDDDDVASITEVESLLHQCRRSFPVRTLNWHYRSKHESLIAVSNQEFYNNQLFVYPSPYKTAQSLGLKIFHVKDAFYIRGKSATNPGEAKAVVEEAIKHFEKHPKKSLGIGAFSIAQQEAIRNEIERVKKLERPDMEFFFKEDKEKEEHFFVKNLETIQGDERDVIFLSVGYGKDEPNGRVLRTFGPLTKAGGERRLNVLITRARERCVVFANFHARELQVDPNSSFGVRALKTFLDYAETGRLRESQTVRQDTESPFEDSVMAFLRSRGYEVHSQVGCGRFRVDLAVGSPQNPGEYLLGIECDGAQYHSSRVARERDRLRNQILEDKGWSLYHIWSTDWFRNPCESEEKLLREIEVRKFQCQQNNLSSIEKITNLESSFEENVMAMDSDNSSLSPMKENQIVASLQESTIKDFGELKGPEFLDKQKSVSEHLSSGEGNDETEKIQKAKSFPYKDIFLLFDGKQKPYLSWNYHPLPDPQLSSVSNDQIMQGLVEIISAEGPIVAFEAYLKYGKAVDPPIKRIGRNIQETFNRALKLAIRRGLIQGEDEFKHKEFKQKIVRETATPLVVVRNRGNRVYLEDIPPSEVGAMMFFLYSRNMSQSEEELYRGVLEKFGFVRITADVKQKLDEIKKRFVDPMSLSDI